MESDVREGSNIRLSQIQSPRVLKRESERLKTFANWTVSFMDPKKLAENGFYYTNIGDVVKCAFCGILMGSWEEEDVPEQEHLRNSKNCPFINGRECGNIPLTEGGEEDKYNRQEEREEVRSKDVCGFSYGLDIRPFSAPERLGKIPLALELMNLNMDFEDLGISKVSGPVTPHYASYNARLKTFVNWPVPEIQKPEKLAEAGFYYISRKDNVLCFHCGGGLKNWEAEDDPWVEHAKWFGKCGFIILRKGIEFVKEVIQKDKWPEVKVTEESPAKEARESVELKEKCLDKKKAVGETTSSSPSASSSSDEDNQLSQSPDPSDTKDLELCRICYARKRRIVFLPCGHFVSCTHCAPSLSVCAVCRKPIKSTFRAYLS